MPGCLLQKQRREAQRTRRLGLGVMGLADALCMLGLRYDSPVGRDSFAGTFEAVRNAAYDASSRLAVEKGSCAACPPGQLPSSRFLERLPAALRPDLTSHGRCNSHILAITPTWSISLLTGGASTGIEPSFGARRIRNMPMPDGEPESLVAIDRAVILWQLTTGSGSSLSPALGDVGSIAASAQIECSPVSTP